MYEQWEEYIPAANNAAYLICSRCVLYLPHLQDASQEARIVLWQMSLRYEPDRGVHFWTFAGDRIRGAVWDYLRQMGASARSGQQSRRELLDLDEAKHVGGASLSYAVRAFERSNSGVATTSPVHGAGSKALQITGHGYHDFAVPVDAVSTTITIYGRTIRRTARRTSRRCRC